MLYPPFLFMFIYSESDLVSRFFPVLLFLLSQHFYLLEDIQLAANEAGKCLPFLSEIIQLYPANLHLFRPLQMATKINN